jgi:uncharacterized membrane protein HdeD (DUF308 family)
MSRADQARARLDRSIAIDLLPRAARFWWIAVVRGTIALALGLSALLWSGSTERLATFLALYWLAGGIVSLRLAWAVHPTKGFRLASIAGVVAITAALLIGLRESLSEFISPATMVDVLGFVAAAIGTLRLVGAFEVERSTGHRWSIGGLVLGGLELGTGLILMATDDRSHAVMVTVGVWALASGTLLILEGLRAHRKVRATIESHETAP